MTSIEFCACKKSVVDFSKLTNNQAKQLSNAINNIVGVPLYYYSYNIRNLIFKFLVDETPLEISNTFGGQKVFYSLQDIPYVIKVNETVTPLLKIGEYILIQTNLGGIQAESVYKTLESGTIIGDYSTSSTMGINIVDFNEELIPATPFSVVIENNTNTNTTLVLYSSYSTVLAQTENSTTVVTKHYTMWDSCQVQLKGFNMLTEAQSIKATVWDDLMTTNYGSITFESGIDYSSGVVSVAGLDGAAGAGNRNYKLVIEYI